MRGTRVLFIAVLIALARPSAGNGQGPLGACFLQSDSLDPQRHSWVGHAFLNVVDHDDILEALSLPEHIRTCALTPEIEARYIAARYSVGYGIMARGAELDEVRAMALEAVGQGAVDLARRQGRPDPTEWVVQAVEMAAESYQQGIDDLRQLSEVEGYHAATWMLFRTYVYEGKIAEAVAFARARAAMSDPVGQFALGHLHWAGLGVTQDSMRAVELISASSAQGYPQAQFTLGWMHDHGYAVARDEGRAIELYEAAVEGKHPLAAFALGLRYRDGIGTPVDLARALELFQFAGMAGLGSGAAEAGWAYLRGRGTEVDRRVAWVWLNRARAWGHALATVHWALLVNAGEHDSIWSHEPSDGRVVVLEELDRVRRLAVDESVRQLADETYRRIEASPLPPTRTVSWQEDRSLSPEGLVVGLVLGAILLSALGDADAGPAGGAASQSDYVPGWQDPNNPQYWEFSYLSNGASLCC